MRAPRERVVSARDRLTQVVFRVTWGAAVLGGGKNREKGGRKRAPRVGMWKGIVGAQRPNSYLSEKSRTRPSQVEEGNKKSWWDVATKSNALELVEKEIALRQPKARSRRGNMVEGGRSNKSETVCGPRNEGICAERRRGCWGRAQREPRDAQKRD